MRRGADYHGLDIAAGPVTMVSERMRRLGANPENRVVQGEPSTSHSQTHKLRPALHDRVPPPHRRPRAVGPRGTPRAPASGTALAYLRQPARVPPARAVSPRGRSARRPLAHAAVGTRSASSCARCTTRNQAGEAAPHTDYVSVRDARKLFRDFRQVRVAKENFDTLVWFGGRFVLPRERFLGSVARVVGLDHITHSPLRAVEPVAQWRERAKPLLVLLLCDDNPAHAANLLEHIKELVRLSRHSVRMFNPRAQA